MNILIYGSTGWNDSILMKKYFSLLPKDAIILSDNSKGASLLALNVAAHLEIQTKLIFPEIARSFKTCGLFYDSYLSQYGLPEIVFLFKLFKPFCRTSHLITERARAKQIQVIEIFQDGTMVEQLSLLSYTSPLKGAY